MAQLLDSYILTRALDLYNS